MAPSHEADSGKFGQDVRTYNRLFQLLSCRRINDAVSLTERAGMFRLATLLSQLDGDTVVPTLMRNQLAIWKASEADQTMAPELLKLYRLLAGTVIAETEQSSESQSDLQGLGWLRGVGILFWYCSSTDSFVESISTLSSALESYRILLQDTFADPPTSPYVQDKDAQGADMSYPQTKHGLYSLLELLFPSTTASAAMDLDAANLELDIRNHVIAALQPAGYTRDALDHRASYLLLAVLECGGISHINATHAHIIRQHYIFQLLSAGQWQWALFVALQFPDVSARYCLVSDILQRFAGEYQWEQEEQRAAGHVAFPSMYAFLTTSLNIPAEMLHEANAHYAGYQQNFNKQVNSLLSAGKYALATEITVRHLAPVALLASGTASSKLLELLESIADMAQQEQAHAPVQSVYGDHWADLSAVFLAFLRLKQGVVQLSGSCKGDRQNDMIAVMEVPDLIREARELLERLTAVHQQRAAQFAAAAEKITRSKSSQLASTDDMSKEEKLIQIVLFDMGTYIYELLQSLDLISLGEEDDSAVARHRFLQVQSLLSRDCLERAPVLQEKLAVTTSRCNSEFLQGAASRLVASHG